MKIDLHAHTSYSRDATLTPAALVQSARRAGLDRIAVTDHNRIEGAWEAHRLDPSLIIPGEEIDCADGSHLIGLFLHDSIPRGLTVEDVANRIRAQGGIVYAPHPFAYLRWPRRKAERTLAVADIVEVFNGRAFWPPWNRRALRAAQERGLGLAARSDGHFAHEIGGAWTETPTFGTAAEFRAILAEARPQGIRRSSPFVHVASLGIKLAKTIGVIANRESATAELTANG
ncbi:MAG: PHP domain-containing protein [Longimicrobiales bacterium]